MSDKLAAGSERNSAAAESSARAVAGNSNAQTVLPQSRDPLTANTKRPSASDGTSITGAIAASIASDEQAVGVGTELGCYRLLKKLGEGGMGSVWQALHIKLDKLVAVKVLPATWSRDPALLTRFEREMKAVGKLEHPHIVRAMDAGEFQGTHYLVMEFNEGQDLSLWVKSRGPQSISNACEMLRQAALGLAHAHEAGLIHRDIKPSNLFLTKLGKVKILDLGLARVQGDNAGGGQTLTGFGQVLGTPDYMAPEQWENTHTADGRSDLYALGCTLFYFLTGRAPYSDERHSSLVGKMKGHTLDPIPDLKSARREAVASRPKLANDLISDELDALYRKLMSKNPDERFASASELAQALAAFVKSKAEASGVLVKGSSPVAPRQESRTSLDATSTTDSQPKTSVPRAPGDPVAERQGYGVTAPFIMTEFVPDAPTDSLSAGDAPTILAMFAGASSSTTQHDAPASGRLPVVPSLGGRTSPTSDHSLARRARTPGLKLGLILGGLAAFVLLSVLVITITKKGGTPQDVADLEDTEKVEITESSSDREASASGPVRLPPSDRVSIPSGSPVDGTGPKSKTVNPEVPIERKVAEVTEKPESLPQPKPTPVAPSTTSNNPTVPDSKSSADTKKPTGDAVASLTPNKSAPNKPPVFTLAPKVAVSAETFKFKVGSPISSRALVGHPSVVRDLRSWSIEMAVHTASASGIAYSPDGAFVATASIGDDTLRIWRIDETDTRPTLTLHSVFLGESGGIWDVAWSPDGQTIAVTTHFGSDVALYSFPDGRRLRSFSLGGMGGRAVSWSPDGRWLAVPTGRLGMIDPVAGTIALSKSGVSSVYGCWSPDGRAFATIDEEGKLKFWNPVKLEMTVELAAFSRGLNGGIAWSPDGRWIATGTVDGHVRIWDASLRRVVHDLSGEHLEVFAVAWEPKPLNGVENDPNWPRLVSVGNPNGVVWNVIEGKKLVSFGLQGHSLKTAWSPDGKRIATVATNRPALHDAATGELLSVAPNIGQPHNSSSSHVTADGKTLRALIGSDLLIFNGESGEYLKRLGNMPGFTLAVSPKDDWLAAYNPGKEPGELIVIDTATYEQRRPLAGHSGKITGVNFSPDGSRLVSSGMDGLVKVWKSLSGELLKEIKHDRAVRNAVWSPDGKSLATCAEDDVIRLFGADSGKETRKFNPLPAPSGWGPSGIAWSSTGDLIAIAPHDAQARVLDVKSGKLSEPFVAFQGSMSSVAWSSDGKQLLVGNGGEVGYRALTAKTSQHVFGYGLPIQWLGDKRRVLGGQNGSYPIQAVDTRKGSRLGVLFPKLVSGGWLCIGSDGHYRGSEDIESQIVYVALRKDGSQTTHTAAEFASKFGWKNDPAKAGLLKLDGP